MQLQPGRVTYYGGGPRSSRDRGQSEQEDRGPDRVSEAEAGGGSDKDYGGADL